MFVSRKIIRPGGATRTAGSNDMEKRDSVGLSTRETEIVQLISEGCSNRQIARRLSIAESTVKSHLSSALGKLGVGSRSEAVSVLVKGGPGGGRWAELTARQTEVLRLVAAGYSNQRIAESLGISPRTVKAHLESVHQRLGVHSRVAAVAAVRRTDVPPSKEPRGTRSMAADTPACRPGSLSQSPPEP
jgi:DNA-binding CsgD family transcriptional regulator